MATRPKPYDLRGQPDARMVEDIDEMFSMLFQDQGANAPGTNRSLIFNDNGEFAGAKYLTWHPVLRELKLHGTAMDAGLTQGPVLTVGRNNNGGGIAGSLQLVNKAGDGHYVWPDANGVFRFHTDAPGGTVSDTVAPGAAVAAAFMALGSAPATSGGIRMSNDSYLTWRNAAGDGDIEAFTVTAFNNMLVGPNTDTDLAFQSNDTVRWRVKNTGQLRAENGTETIQWGSTSAFPMLKRSGQSVEVRLADDSEYGDLRVRLGEYGLASSTAAVLVVNGGASGGAMIQLRRTTGLTQNVSFRLTNGGLSVVDDTTANIVGQMLGDGSVNQFYVGVRGFTTTNTRPSLVAASSQASGSGTDVAGVDLRLRGGAGTGTGTPGPVIFQTFSTTASGTGAQTAVSRWAVRGTTGHLDSVNGTEQIRWGATSSFPALKRSGTELQVRLADDSAYGGFDALAVRFDGGTAIHSGGTNILEQRNGTAAQTYRLYNSYTDASNFERFNLLWSGNTAFFTTAQAGTGVSRQLNIGTNGTANLVLQTNSSGRWIVEGSTGDMRANVSTLMLKWGTSSSVPALKASGTTLQARLANDSNFAPFAAAGYSAAGSAGVTDTIQTADEDITITGGIITAIAPGGSGGGAGADGYWVPITDGDPTDPALIFDDDGRVIVAFVPTA